MYNRYIPQPDGTYHRNPMQEPAPPPRPSAAPAPPVPRGQPCPEPSSCPSPGVGSFFRRLLPKDFCTEDLLIVLLLLLMTGDRKEDQSFALLTLALYLFL